MARSILGEYGPDTPKEQAPRITKNGPASVRDVMGYQPPQGPIGISRVGVGLGGDNHDCGMYGSSEHMSGSPGQLNTRVMNDGLDNDDVGLREDD